MKGASRSPPAHFVMGWVLASEREKEAVSEGEPAGKEVTSSDKLRVALAHGTATPRRLCDITETVCSEEPIPGKSILGPHGEMGMAPQKRADPSFPICMVP